MDAELLLSDRRAYPDDSFVEMTVWRVPRTQRTPEGFKYSLVYIDSQGRRVLGFDNHEGRGHHRHDGDRETPYAFTSIKKLRKLFEEEVERIRRDR